MLKRSYSAFNSYPHSNTPLSKNTFTPLASDTLCYNNNLIHTPLTPMNYTHSRNYNDNNYNPSFKERSLSDKKYNTNLNLMLSSIKEEVNEITQPIINSNSNKNHIRQSIWNMGDSYYNNSDTNKHKHKSKISFNKSTYKKNNCPDVINNYFYKPNDIDRKEMKTYFRKINPLVLINHGCTKENIPLRIVKDNENRKCHNISNSVGQVESLVNAWDCLESKIKGLKKENDNLVKDNNVYKTKCNEFEKENSQIKKQLFDNSKNSSVHIMDNIKQIKQKEEDIKMFQQEINNLNMQITKLKNNIDILYKENSQLKNKSLYLQKQNQIKIQIQSDKKVNINKLHSNELTQMKLQVTSLTNENRVLIQKINELSSQIKIPQKPNTTLHHTYKSLSINTINSFTINKQLQFLLQLQTKVRKNIIQQEITFSIKCIHVKKTNKLQSQLKQQNIQLQSELITLKDQSATNINNLNKELSALKKHSKKNETSLSHLESLNKSLQNDKESLTTKLSLIENQLLNAISSNTNLQHIKASLESELLTLKQTMQANQEENIPLKEHKQLQTKLLSKTNLISQLLTKKEQVTNLITTHENTIHIKETKINELTSQLNLINKSFDKISNENIQLKEEMITLLSNNENITKDILSLSSQKKEITFQINQYQSQIKTIQNQLDLNTIEKENYKNQIDILKIENNSLQTNNKKLNDELEIQCDLNTQLNKIIHDKNKKLQSLLDLISKLNTLKFISLQDLDVETQDTDNDEVLLKIDTVINIITLSICEFKQLDALAKLITDYKEMLLLLNDEKDKNDSITAEIDKIKQQNFDLISQKQELNLKLQNIETEYKKLLMSDKFINSKTILDNSEYEGMRLQIKSLQQYIKDKENEMNTLKEMIKKIKNK